MSEAQLEHPLMAGIELPPRLQAGHPDPELVERWVDVVEVLVGRGARAPNRLAKLLGIPHITAKRWLGVVKEKWTKGLSDDRINWRREKLYYEADEVAIVAWKEALTTFDPNVKAAMLRIVLEANKRKASLIGLDKMEIKIKGKVETTSRINLVATVEAKHGLAPGALASIGQAASMLLSGQQLPEGRLITAGPTLLDEVVRVAMEDDDCDDVAGMLPGELFAGISDAPGVNPGDVWIPTCDENDNDCDEGGDNDCDG